MNGNSAPIILREIAYNEAGINYAITSHVHHLYQWYCLIHGGVDIQIEETVFNLKPEESVLIPSGLNRSTRCREKAPGYLYALFENYGLNLDNLPNKVIITPNELRYDLISLVKELTQPGTNTNILVETLLIRLLIGLERSVHENERQKHCSNLNLISQEEIVERIDAYMRRNLHRYINREQLAEVVHLSPSHLAKVFKQLTGKTLTDRLIELRISRAKQLLLESTLSVSEISLQIGYTSFSHFSHIFRVHVDMSPGDYRRSQGNSWKKLGI